MLIRVQRNNPLPREVTNHFVMFTCTNIRKQERTKYEVETNIYCFGEKTSTPSFYLLYNIL